GLMQVTTKSGTNQYRGTLWEFFRNDALDSRNFFAAVPQPFRENIFGAAVGGPIKKNKLFFFATYEGTRNMKTPLGGSGRGLVPEFFQTLPTPAQRRGDFAGKFNADGRLRQIYDPYSTRIAADGTVTRDPFSGNIIPQTRLSPIALKVLEKVPQP